MANTKQRNKRLYHVFCCATELEIRLATNPINQPVRPEMRKNSMQRRNSPKHCSSYGEANPLKQELSLPPHSLRKPGIRNPSTQHIPATGIQTDRMPPLIQYQTPVHPQKRHGAHDSRDQEDGTQSRMQMSRRGGHCHLVERRKDHEDKQMHG